jgi:hypothetical protein
LAVQRDLDELEGLDTVLVRQGRGGLVLCKNTMEVAQSDSVPIRLPGRDGDRSGGVSAAKKEGGRRKEAVGGDGHGGGGDGGDGG